MICIIDCSENCVQRLGRNLTVGRCLQPFASSNMHRCMTLIHPIPSFRKERIGFVVDAQTGMLPGVPESAVCVQRFDDSLNLTIHTTYRNSLRSSSLREPRHPLLAVVFVSFARSHTVQYTALHCMLARWIIQINVKTTLRCTQGVRILC